MHPIETSDPLHTVAMDVITGLPVSHGFNALLTITDKFTKASMLLPCKDTTTAEDTAKLYLNRCYSVYGLPAKVISDREQAEPDRHLTMKNHLVREKT